MKTKLIYILLILLAVIILFNCKVYARITTSDPVVNSGETATIYISSQEGVASGAIKVISSDPALTFVSASGGTTNGTFVAFASAENKTSGIATYVFRTPTVSETKRFSITFQSQDMADADGNPVASTTATATITVKAPEATTPSTPSTPTTQTKSSNANLSNLGINPYDFRGFKTATTSYSVSVPKSVSTINIYATAQHSKAKISGTGNKNLEIGRNTFNVVVTAEDGTKKTYTLYITRKADEEPVSEEPETPELTATGTLSTLAIEGIALTPEFNVEIKEYTVVIPEEMTEVNITATPIKETYNVQIEGGKDLKLGENTATISVSTEEGVIETYTIKIIRGKIKASLKSLAIGYLDRNGKYIELKFTPIFKEDVLEYTIDNLEHIVNSLKIEAVPSKEEYTVEITGNEKLEDGRNVITIKVKNTTENEEIEEIEYKIIVNRKKENKTGIIGKIKNAFTGFTGGIGEFIKNNNDKIVFYSIASCAVVMFGLSIYLIYDYKRYKMMLEKIRTLTRENASIRRNQVETVHENNENITE